MGRRWTFPNPETLTTLDFVQARTYFVARHGLPVGGTTTYPELCETLKSLLPLLAGDSRAAHDAKCLLCAQGYSLLEI